jgi:hypothetical protein
VTLHNFTSKTWINLLSALVTVLDLEIKFALHIFNQVNGISSSDDLCRARERSLVTLTWGSRGLERASNSTPHNTAPRVQPSRSLRQMCECDKRCAFVIRKTGCSGCSTTSSGKSTSNP